jgi:hypothetical protein
MIAAIIYDRPDVETLAAVIARSQIIVAPPAKCLPAGYTDVDVAVLDWIAAEGRRVRGHFLRI